MNRFFLLLFIFTAYFTFSQPSKTLQEAIDKHQLDYSVYGKKGNGFFQSLEIKIKNISQYKLKIEIQPGTIFHSEHEWVQDQIIVKALQIVLLPKEEEKIQLTSMCIQNHNTYPPQGEVFPSQDISSGHLFKLANLINTKNYQKSTAQSAIWSITDGASTNNIYSLDSVMVSDLCSIVSEATGEICPRKNNSNKRHHISYINSNIEYLSTNYHEKTSLSVYDISTNSLLHTYWSNYNIKPGYYNFKIGYSHYKDDSTKFKLILKTKSGTTLSQKIISINDSIPKQIELNEETYITYELPETINSRVGIYNDKDELYLLLADNYKMEKGFRKTNFIKGSEVPFGQKYFLKVKNKETDSFIVAKQVYLDELSKNAHKNIVRRGRFSFNIEGKEQKAKLAVYNAKDELIWVVFNHSTLGHGHKIYNYVFEHNEGPQAIFYIRMTDINGKTLKELKLTPK